MPSITRKKGVAVKMKKADLGNNGVDTKVAEFLRTNPDDAYTVAGIMIDLYDVPPHHVKGSWTVWPEGLSALYGRVLRALEHLYETGKVSKGKKGNAYFWGWKQS